MMGWASAGPIFDGVAKALIDARASDQVKRQALSALIGQLKAGDWDTEHDSLGRFADDDPAIADAFREHGIVRNCGDEGGPDDADWCSLDVDHDGDHADDLGHTWPQAEVEALAYPAPGSVIPGQPGYVVGECGHRVAGSEWRAGLRACERCPSTEQEPPGALWPPRAGDVWRDRDSDLWFATDMNAADDPTGPCIEFVSTRLGDHEDPDEARRRWGPISLVYRAQDSAIPDVLAEVRAERAAQDEKWGEQNHPDGTGGPAFAAWAGHARRVCQRAAGDGVVSWQLILDEEVAEAFAEDDPAKLRAELIQVAAVAINWIGAIDRRTATEAAT